MGIKKYLVVLPVLAITLSLVGPSFFALAAPARADYAWRGEYFNNTTLSGEPALVRYDSTLRFEWGTGAPVPGINADNFSVRWTRRVQLDWSGNYRFYADSDDGLRVWVDDLLVIDQWHDRQEAWITADVHLSTGEHDMKVEYYEHLGAATVKLIYQPEEATLWKAEYFPNVELDGDPGRTDYFEDLDIDWGGGSPGEWFHKDWFSARFTRDVFLPAGTHRFSLTTEGGVRLWVGGGLVIDEWHETDETTHTGTATIGAGNHQVKVEYYDSYHSASVRLIWQPAQPPPPRITGWRGEYYTNPDLSGGATVIRDDPHPIDLDWGEGAPATGLPSDFFSVRWTRSAYFSPAGHYRFTVTTDDGVRMWVDDKQVLDEWHRSDSQTYLVDMYLAVGTHTVKVEHYEHTGLARIRVDWRRAQTTETQAVVDNTDAGFTRGGDEAGWTFVRTGYGRQSWRAANHAGWWARWTPILLKPGRYEAFVFVPWVYNATEKAHYYLKHEGDIETFTIDQRRNAGRWVSLGTYTFNANPGTEFVHLDCANEEPPGSRNIGFDAVKFVAR